MNISIINRYRLPSHMLFYIGMFLVFLVIGVWGGRSIGSSGFFIAPDTMPHDSSREISPPTDLPETGQKNLLVIGVDNLSVAQPRLESTWLVMYFPGKPDFTFLPIYPQPEEEDELVTSTFLTTFSMDEAGRPSKHFFQQLSNHIWWNNYLVIDQASLTELIGLLGDFPQGDLYLDQAQALEEMPSAWEDSGAAYAAQAKLLSGLCDQARALPLSSRTITAAKRIIDNGLATDLNLESFSDNWLTKGDNTPNLQCEFPLLPSSIR